MITIHDKSNGKNNPSAVLIIHSKAYASRANHRFACDIKLWTEIHAEMQKDMLLFIRLKSIKYEMPRQSGSVIAFQTIYQFVKDM